MRRLPSPAFRRRARRVKGAVIVAATVALMTVSSIVASPAPAQAAALPSSIIDGGYIISDAEFYDSTSMTQSQIQAFLDDKGRPCSKSTCLKNLRATLTAHKADEYCKAVPGEKKATAARMIYRAATACGINPKVILVMMQKEQGLVTTTSPTTWGIDHAMGQNCPDNDTGCAKESAGFWKQVYLGARQMQIYTKHPGSFRYKAKQANTIQWAPSLACGTSKVTIKNQATANLYNYTPYRPNIAALAAGWGIGDACSTYGNRNFYNYYVQWFEPAVAGTGDAPAQIAGCTAPKAAEVVAVKASASTAFVTPVSLNARTAPTTRCGTGLISLPRGTKVKITGTYGAWSHITVSGKTRWVTSSYLTSPFDDVPASYLFSDEIAWLSAMGITTGYPDGTFHPRRSITREAMAAFLYRAAGKPSFTAPKRSPFTDVSPKDEFYKEITWLSKSKITTGYDDGTYHPKRAITREAMAAFLHRFDNGATSSGKGKRFPDVPTSALFYRDISWLSGSGITTGYDDGTFRPRNKVTREATAAFLYRMKH